MKNPFTTNQAPVQPPPARERARQKPARSAGFTLVELLVVMVIAAILIAMMGGAYMTARNHAKRGRAETQLRELCKAWTEYYLTYTNWPGAVGGPAGGNNVAMSYATLTPLFAEGNDKGIPFISIKIATGENYCDPWGNPYKISFGSGQAIQESAMRIAVSFPNRDRYRE